MRYSLILVMMLFLAGCIYRMPQSDQFTPKQVETSNFSMAIWEKNTIQPGQPLRLYFEGDGDPNPTHTIAFDFAKRDRSANVIYIARPCQWVNDKLCDQKPQIYKEARFHSEIMKELKELTMYLIRKYKAPSVELIGYDGGAVVALNLATVFPTTRVITIAGITDVSAYNIYHNILQDEEVEEDIDNPADQLGLLAEIPQIHYVGKDDDITPRRLVERFVARMENPRSAIVKVVPNTNHINWEGVELDY